MAARTSWLMTNGFIMPINLEHVAIFITHADKSIKGCHAYAWYGMNNFVSYAWLVALGGRCTQMYVCFVYISPAITAGWYCGTHFLYFVMLQTEVEDTWVLNGNSKHKKLYRDNSLSNSPIKKKVYARSTNDCYYSNRRTQYFFCIWLDCSAYRAFNVR